MGITAIDVVNGQSIGSYKLNLAQDRVNVIIGDNNRGKSVLFKLLRVLFCEGYIETDRLTELIKWNCDYAICACYLTGGGSGGVTIYHDRAEYFYRESDDLPYTLSKRPLQEFLNRCNILSSDKYKFIPNIIDTVQAKLLVDPQLKQNSEFISLLVSNEELNKIIEVSEKEISEYRTATRELNKKINIIEGQIIETSYVDVEVLSKQISLAEALYEVGYAFIDIYTEYENIIFGMPKEQLDFYTSLSEYGVKLESIVEIVEDIKIVDRVENTDLELLELLMTLDSIKTLTSDINFLSFDMTSLELCKTLEIINDIYAGVDDIAIMEYNSEGIELLDALSVLYRVYYELPTAEVYTDYSQEMDKISVYEVLDSVYSEVLKLETNLLENIEISFELIDLKDKISSYKIIDNCPRFGKVIIENETCVPYNN